MQTKAPDFPGPYSSQQTGYPSRGAAIGPAWQEMWDLLVASDGPLDGKALSAEVAERHSLAPATLEGILRRAAVAGFLSKTRQDFKSTRGTRRRTFYAVVDRGDNG